MKYGLNFGILGLVLFLSGGAFAKGLTTEQKVLDFQQLMGQIKSSYGPLEYKIKVQHIDIDALQKKYLSRIEASTTDAEFYDLVLRFNAEFHDSHFGLRIPSKKRASLGFITDLVAGHVLISDIDVKTLPTAQFPIQRGDEVLTFNNQPVLDVIGDLSLRRGMGYAHTALRIGAMSLASRSGTNFSIPTGTANVAIKSKADGSTKVYEMPWVVTGKDFDFGADFTTMSGSFLDNQGFSYNQLSIKDLFTDILGPQIERSYMCSGTSRIERPAGAVVISEAPVVAYYYPTSKGNIGYLRIPHYMPLIGTDATAEDQTFAMYEYLIAQLEKNTVGLIIDQDHNCGGSVSLLHHILSLFVDTPVQTTQFRLVASKENILSTSKEIDDMNPLSLVYLQAQDILARLEQSWTAGEFLTSKISFEKGDLVYPNPTRYSKPIVMLIDELSGSGGDAFPSLMGGYHRAVLLGTRTMGAGGHVTEGPALNFSQMKINMTRSLFYRPDGVEVENNGAVPSIPYEITPEDFNQHYIPYREFYTQKLLDLI